MLNNIINNRHANYCCIAILAFIAAIIISITSPVSADSFACNISLRTVYDDNIINYSDADLDQMDDTSASENKFGIKSKDDFIIIPGLKAVFKTKIAGHSTHFGARGAYYYYQDNDIKRYYKVRGFIKRYLKKGIYLQTSFGFIPDYYYRNSYISIDSIKGYHEAKFDKITADVKFSATLFKGLRSNLYYHYSNKDFVSLFDERDITSHGGEIQLIYRPVRLWKAWGSYNYTTAKGAGADNDDYRRDTSYDSNLMVLGLRFYLRGIANKRFELAGKGSYKIIYFQTDKITDIYRFGRTDYRSSFSFYAKHYISSKFSAGITFNRIIKTTDLPLSTEYLKEVLEYSSDSFYSVLSFTF